MQNAAAVLKFLTLGGRFDTEHINPRQIGRGAPFFPLVGLSFGLVLALLNNTLEPYLESEILGVALIAMLIIMTGAIHLEGAQKTFDALPGGTVSENQSNGVYGLIALLLIVLFKVRVAEVSGETRNMILLLAPVFARWSLVIFLYGSRSAADDFARVVAENVRGWHLLVTTAATLLFAIYFVGRTGLWIGLALSLFALVTRTYLHRRHGGITRNDCGALIELSETFSLVLFASL
jgi:adenosylcobinamide-GDP ribazoletransferase